MKLRVAASATTITALGAFVCVANAQQGNFCGSSWVDAVSCRRPCPTGAPTQCSAGETCFANTPCKQSTPPPTAKPIPPPIPPQQQSKNDFNAQNEPWGDPNVYASGGTCGNGQRGNGQCPIPSECCSQYGHCGTSADHCAPVPVPAATTTFTNSNNNGGIAGTCGGGRKGNGICPNQAECCSQYGHCGTSADHCSPVPVPPVATTTTTSNGGIVGTCGGGLAGNGICPDPAECCSEYGFCGTTTMHCGDNNAGGNAGPSIPNFQPSADSGQQQQATPQFNQNGILVPGMAPQQQQQVQSPQVFGSCGGGQIGNGICPLNSECCSKFGFCGSTLEHCTNKVGPTMPGQPMVPQQNNGMNQLGMNGMNGNQQQQQPSSNNASQQQSTNALSEQQTAAIYNSPVQPHGTNKNIIGYYAGWQWYDRDKLAKPSNMDFRKVQRVNYAFFQPDSLGNIFGTDRWGDPQLLFGPYSSELGGGVQRCSYDGPNEVNCAYHEINSGIIYQAHQQGAEVYPSIGGWTLSDHFPILSANQSSRDFFSRKCVDLLTYYGFDGIDIDWEYPGYADHSGTPADKENFTKMLQSIKYALEQLTRTTGKVYGLTAALPCNPDNIANIEVEKVATILTEFNLMSYDLHGAWDDVSGTNAPLFYQGFGNEEFSIHRCVENYVARGVPRDKINIGLPFYGRSFKYAKALNQPHGGNDLGNWAIDDGTPQYFNIHKKLPYMIQVRDNKSKTQYAYISHQEQGQTYSDPNYSKIDGIGQSMPEGLVSFDDERAICDKVHYVLDRKLGGFIIWELSGDVLDDLRTPLLDITNKKLANPSLQCCALHSQDECDKERLEEERAKQHLANSQMNGFDSSRWDKAPAASSGSRRRDGCLRLLSFGLLISAMF